MSNGFFSPIRGTGRSQLSTATNAYTHVISWENTVVGVVIDAQLESQHYGAKMWESQIHDQSGLLNVTLTQQVKPRMVDQDPSI